MAKVCLVSSAGGHLTQAVSIAGELQDEHDFILCVTGFEGVRQNGEFEGVSRVYLAPFYWQYQIPFGVILSLLASLWMFVRVFRRERPDFIVTTGAEIAIPALLVNRLFFHRPSLFIESVSRIDTLSLTGRIAYHLADRVFVQWPGLLRHYGPRAEYYGRLL
jgi:UDP-N-acetylglucosamine:LPS N-acetylglucosamine transferase